MVKRVDKLFEVGTLPELGTLPEKMYAWVLRNETLGEPCNAFREEIVNVPHARKGEVIVANLYAGINYNGVWAALGKPKNVVAENGNYSDDKEDFHICGSECSGIIYDVGEGVTSFKIGDMVSVGASQYDEDCPFIKNGADPVNSPSFRVWGYESNWGAFSQFCRVKEMQCHKIPEGMDLQQAAVYTAAGAAVYRMLTHWEGNTVKPGDIVLIYGGSGGVGSSAIQMTKALGGIPIAVVSDDERGEFCKSIGAKGYINRKKFRHWGELTGYTDPDTQKKWIFEAMKFKREIWRIAGEKKSPAIVIEHPGRDTMPTSLFVCDNNGMVVLCGATSSYLANIDLRFLWLGQKRIQGSHSATPEDYVGFVKFITENHITPHIGRVFKWSELPMAHQIVYEDRSAMGRMLVKIADLPEQEKL